MAAGISRKELKRDELVEATRGAGEWFEKHGRSVAIAAGLAAVVLVVYLGWRWNLERKEAAASASLGDGRRIYQAAESSGFQAQDLERAAEKFAQATDAGRDTSAGRLALYWHAATLMRLGRPAEAATELEPLYRNPGVPPTLAGSAEALAAEALASAGDRAAAEALLQELASADPEIYPAEQALMSLAVLREKAGDSAGARRAWQEIVDRFPGRGAATQAREHLGR